ncbi:hypothetical protein LCGC14_2909040 [marine sediment metagenome]|uniref:Uncharacterized protein n=1 Tax=marine sediment metagenome TaxID=412755 RepID=A0A0F8YE22_9ZZZZ
MAKGRAVHDHGVEVLALDMLLKGEEAGEVDQAGEDGDVVGQGLVHVAPDEQVAQPGEEGVGRVVTAGHRLQRPEVGGHGRRPVAQGVVEGGGEAGPEALIPLDRLFEVLRQPISVSATFSGPISSGAEIDQFGERLGFSIERGRRRALARA